MWSLGRPAGNIRIEKYIWGLSSNASKNVQLFVHFKDSQISKWIIAHTCHCYWCSLVKQLLNFVMIHGERRMILHNGEAEFGILYSTSKIILVQGVENEDHSEIHHALSISKFLTKHKWHCFSSHSIWQI